MIRFIHTADIQLGMRATDVPQVADAVREVRFDTLGRVVALAVEEEVDFILVAGDLFEDNQVSADTAYRTTSVLAEANQIPVYVLPGNHDPLSAGSIYHRSTFRDQCPENVLVLDARDPLPLSEECVLYPCPVEQQRSTFDPTARLGRETAVAQDSVGIGVAHGSLAIEGRYSADDHPIATDVATRAGLDYLALGHWHSRYVHDERTAYPGTPEPTAFGERDSGSVLLVTIDGPGAPAQIETRSVGELEWLTWDVDLTPRPAELIEEQRRRVEGIRRRDKTLLRVAFRGAVALDSLSALDDFTAWLTSQGLLYTDVRRDVAASEVILSRLNRLAEQDAVLAGAVADLQALAAVGGGGEEPRPPLGAEPQPIEDLLAVWNKAKGTERLDRETVVAGALIRLAQLAEEVVL